MEPAHSIGRLGFRRWYERQLIEGHAWLVSCFLCGLAIAVLLEDVSFRAAPANALVALGVVFVLGLVCWHSLGRYQRIMAQAEHLADHSTCERCQLYGRFQVLSERPPITVRCRSCSHEWRLD